MKRNSMYNMKSSLGLYLSIRGVTHVKTMYVLQNANLTPPPEQTPVGLVSVTWAICSLSFFWCTFYIPFLTFIFSVLRQNNEETTG